MSKTGHPGTVTKTGKFVCTHCKAGSCNMCIDLMRAKANLAEVCQCPKNH